MSNRRVYEVARDLKTNHKEVLWIAEKLQIEVKNHMSSLSPEEEGKIRDYIDSMTAKNKDIAKKPEPVKEKPKAPEAVAKPEPVRERQVRPETKKPQPSSGQGKPKPKTSGSRENASGGQRNNRPGQSDRKGRTNNSGNRNRPPKGKRGKRKFELPKEPNIKKVVIGEDITIKDLAMKISRTASDLIGKLMKMGVMATINENIDFDTASLLMDEYKIEVEFKSNKRETEIETKEDIEKELVSRPPVITVMGHVDHGKTSLLDAIRSSRVTEGEAGGITQHIGAYQIEHQGGKLTFIDTPGHAAFTSMRARGAQITDIAILVVAADDGVMPQTIEAINHAKAAKVPIIVAVNKMDKEGANPDRVMQQLTEYGLVSEEWGGDTIFCPVSAIKKEGIAHLLEMILLVSEVQELKANPERMAEGFVIEAQLDKGRGPVATLLVKRGTLRVGDALISGEVCGKVRAMSDEHGANVLEAGPSTPVEVIGFGSVPEAGGIFQSLDDEKLARDVAEQRCIVKKEEAVQKTKKVNLEDLFKDINAGEIHDLNLIVKGDVQGSVEALSQSLLSLNEDTEEVRLSIIHSGVGGINETDVSLASASNAIIIGFNVRPDANAKKLAVQEQVDIKLYRIIYEVIDEVRAAMSGLLTPEIKEVELGTAVIRDTFKVPKAGTIAGCYVTDGKISRAANVRIVRDGVVIFEGELSSLKRFKDDAKEVASGYECGIGFEKFNDLKEGDVIEAYIFEKVARQL